MKSLLKDYMIFCIIGWVTFLPTIGSFVAWLGYKIENESIKQILVTITSVSASLFSLSFIGKIWTIIRLILFTNKLAIQKALKKKLRWFLILSLIIPVVPLYYYKKTIHKELDDTVYFPTFDLDKY